jgi:acyl-homoserine lactone acylase PvdQ
MFTVYGPAFQTADGWVAVRYAGAGDIRSVEEYYRMGKARTYEEWRAAVAMRAIPSTNMVFADNTGRIGYFYNAIMPRRAAGFNWSGCVPGDTSATLWRQGDLVTVPENVAPRSGWLYSANGTPWSSTDPSSDLRPADYPDAAPGIETYLTNRAMRAVETLSPLHTISDAQLLATKFDVGYSTRSRMAAAIARILAADASHDAELAHIQTVLRGWDMHATENSHAASLALAMFRPLYDARRNRLPEPDPVAAARTAAAYLTQHFGRIDPPLGDVLRLRRGNVDLPIDGGPDVLRGILWTPEPDGRWRADDGDGLMMVMDWAPDHTLRVRVAHQFGASEHETSPHYNDQSPLFAAHGFRVQDW